MYVYILYGGHRSFYKKKIIIIRSSIKCVLTCKPTENLIMLQLFRNFFTLTRNKIDTVLLHNYKK